MEVYVSQEVLAGLGITIAAVIIALLVFVRWLLTHLGSFAKALSQHAEVNAALSGQLKDIIQERKTDRREWEGERDTWSEERKTFTDQLRQVKTDYGKRIDDLTLEYTRLQAQLKAERDARERGERDHALKIEQLRNRIADLERERDELRQERDDLKVERDKLSTRVDELYAEVDRLKKHGTGPISDAAQQAAREALDCTPKTEPDANAEPTTTTDNVEQE